MLRKTMLALAFLALLGLAAAQITIAPTPSSGTDQIAKSETSAFVEQTVVMTLPQATALHLAANTIAFDLTALDSPDWEARARSGDQPANFPYACVYVSGDDVIDNLGTDFWSQQQVVPGGIAYAANSWDDISLVYYENGKSGDVPDSERVVTYPPIRIGADGKLVKGSKDYFVCYQTFVIQLFSNFENFRLQVSRADVTLNADGDVQGIKHLYVQGNTCAEFGDLRGTGLYGLPNNATRDLLPRRLTAGPTGTRVGTGCDTNSSWTDVLGVLAVKVNTDLWGPSTANLKYTLISSDTAF